MSTTCNTSMHCFCRLHTSGQWMCCGCGLFASNAQSAISNLQSAAALPGRAQASPDVEPLHTGDDARVDLLTSILAELEEIEMDGMESDADITGIIEEVEKLDALIVATVQRERASADAAVQEPSQWHPIETAPKDRTEILLTDGHYKRSGYWAKRVGCWSVDAVVKLAEPTHWMPLPAAPLPATEPQK